MPGGYSKKELEDTSMESYETWRAARPHPPSNPFGDALPPRPQKGGGEDDEKVRSRKRRCVKHIPSLLIQYLTV
jgi:hypothetical protein